MFGGLFYQTNGAFSGEKLLTSIHAPIHCAAALGQKEDESELDALQIQNFLDTLAEIALAIASRADSSHEDQRDIAA